VAITRIKICGITRVEDARAVADSGADAIGLVFYPSSPRSVDIPRAADIAAALPPFVSVVALFVDPVAARVNAVLDAVPVDLLQFHGEESPSFCRSFSRPFLKALRMKPGADPAATAAAYRGCRGLLLDSWQEGVPGGTGHTFDWRRAGGLDAPLVLAGGLNEDNVGEAMATASPSAVDVSGGVELEPGVKDRLRIEAFVAAVRRADRAGS
jgi:phosphoribosylanthranilate isomerase